MSLRQQLIRSLASILCVVFVLHWLAADLVIRTVAEKQMSTRLSHDGDSLLDTLIRDDKGQLRFNSFHIGSIYEQPFSGHYYVIQVDEAFFYSPSLQNHTLAIMPISSGQTVLYHLTDGPKQQVLLVLGRGFTEFGHQVNITFAEDLTDIDHEITAFRLVYLGLTVIFLLCAIALQNRNIRRSLKPLHDAELQLSGISNGQEQEISLDVPSEIKPLVTEVNRLIALVVRRLQQSRTATGNLAHALKNPLAMIVRIAENPLLAADPALQKMLLAQTSAMQKSIGRELKRARIAGNQQSPQAFNPQHEISLLVNLMQNIYAEKQLFIEFSAPDKYVHCDREDLLELIGNLLDNACKWSRHHISIDISFSHALYITVADDGPGCDTTDPLLLTERGLRLDETIHGHGLGLAIVRDITEFYGGSLDIGRCLQLGGFMAKVRLPLS